MPGQCAKLEMWTQDGQIILKTAESEKPVTPKTLLFEIQKNFFIDFGLHQFKQIRSREVKGDICPYCGSKETIGHGSRTTQTELQIRRWCNNCNRTFIAGHEPVKDHSGNKNKESKTPIIKFLHLLGFNRTEISSRLDITWGAANAVVKKLETEQELEFLEGYYLKHETNEKEIINRLDIKTAEKFPIIEERKEMLGQTSVWDYDGRLALKNKKISSKIVFVSKEDINLLLSLTKTKNIECMKNLTPKDRDVILNYIEDRKDDRLGILPKTHIFTRVLEDSGEINAELIESSEQRDDEQSNNED
ncbi:MAG: hypothetical protein PHW62_00275 [Candidatus Ratteibacteria bacterium]|nr:hypothetical protein [Candidatus Ratteibacteria bacterium]